MSDQMTNKEILDELQKIRTLLTPAAAPPSAKGLKDEFLGFLKKYQVLGLAVAFVMALYLGALVKALVQDLIMPIIGVGLGQTGPGLSNLYVSIFGVGDFLIALITFIIVAFVIFIIVKIAAKWKMD